jgi:hypothetical protein
MDLVVDCYPHHRSGDKPIHVVRVSLGREYGRISENLENADEIYPEKRR